MSAARHGLPDICVARAAGARSQCPSCSCSCCARWLLARTLRDASCVCWPRVSALLAVSRLSRLGASLCALRSTCISGEPLSRLGRFAPRLCIFRPARARYFFTATTAPEAVCEKPSGKAVLFFCGATRLHSCEHMQPAIQITHCATARANLHCYSLSSVSLDARVRFRLACVVHGATSFAARSATRAASAR